MSEHDDVTLDATRTEAPSGGATVPGLVVIFSPRQELRGATLPLLRAPQVLGRRTMLEGDRPLGDARVSTRHAQIRLLDRDTVWIEDLGSRNGTLINGERIEDGKLQGPDVLEVGDTFLQFVPDLLFCATPEPDDAVSQLVLGSSPSTRNLRAELRSIAKLDVPVLLLGPAGAGKENCAKALHAASRREGPFVSLNCALMTEELAASDLFGHTKGAFSGATTSRMGAFRQAQGGTLLLDEIADLPASVQPKLLRALQEWHIRPVGSDRELEVNVRLLTATNKYLPDLVHEGSFRGDLYSRLAAASIDVPPLSERPADIVELAQYFLGAHRPLHPRAVRELLRHPWPYNVRDLKTVIALLSTESTVPITLNAAARNTMRRGLEALGSRPQETEPTGVVWPDDDAGRARTLEQLLAQCSGNVAEVARLVGKRVTSVRRWIARYQIDIDRFRSS